MWIRHLSSLQFLTYVAFFAVVIAAICKFVPGRAAPVRETPYPDEELHAHDAKTAKYFIAGGLFLILGSIHMAVKNEEEPSGDEVLRRLRIVCVAIHMAVKNEEEPSGDEVLRRRALPHS